MAAIKRSGRRFRKVCASSAARWGQFGERLRIRGDAVSAEPPTSTSSSRPQHPLRGPGLDGHHPGAIREPTRAGFGAAISISVLLCFNLILISSAPIAGYTMHTLPLSYGNSVPTALSCTPCVLQHALILSAAQQSACPGN